MFLVVIIQDELVGPFRVKDSVKKISKKNARKFLVFLSYETFKIYLGDSIVQFMQKNIRYVYELIFSCNDLFLTVNMRIAKLCFAAVFKLLKMTCGKL